MNDYLRINQNVIIDSKGAVVELSLEERKVTVRLSKKVFSYMNSLLTKRINAQMLKDLQNPAIERIFNPLIFNDILLSEDDNECFRYGVMINPKRINESIEPIPDEKMEKWCLFGAPADFARDPPRSPLHGPYLYRRLGKTRDYFHDLGDVCLVNIDNIYTYGRKISHITGLLNERGNPSLMIGGDHSLTYFRVKKMANYFSNLLLIQFDAHSDINEINIKKNDILYHDNFISKLKDEGVILDVIQIGVRESNCKYERNYLFENSIIQFDAFSVKDKLEVIKTKIKDRKVYITFDMDAIDPEIFPHVTTPLDSGLSLVDAIEIIKIIKESSNCVTGADIMEFSCGFDENGKMFNHEVHVIDEIIHAITQ